MVSLFVV